MGVSVEIYLSASEWYVSKAYEVFLRLRSQECKQGFRLCRLYHKSKN